MILVWLWRGCLSGSMLFGGFVYSKRTFGTPSMIRDAASVGMGYSSEQCGAASVDHSGLRTQISRYYCPKRI
jgi:hypothetical protein